MVPCIFNSAPWWPPPLLQQQPGHGHNHQPAQHGQGAHAQESSHQPKAAADTVCRHIHINALSFTVQSYNIVLFTDGDKSLEYFWSKSSLSNMKVQIK